MRGTGPQQLLPSPPSLLRTHHSAQPTFSPPAMPSGHRSPRRPHAHALDDTRRATDAPASHACFSSILMRALLVLLAWACAGAHAYVPATNSNDTLVFSNTSQASKLNLQWSGGLASANVSYQLVGANSDGHNKVRTSSREGLDAKGRAQLMNLCASVGRTRAFLGGRIV